MVMSPSMMEMDSPSRKRSHEEYSEDVAVKAEAQVDIKMEPSEMGESSHFIASPSPLRHHAALLTLFLLGPIGTSIPAHLTTTSILSSPAQSSPAALTDAGASTPANGPASPSTPSRKPLQSVAQPAQNTSPAAAQSCTTTPGTMTLPTGQGPPKKQKKQKVLTPEEQAAKDQAEAAKREKNEKAKLAKEQKRVEKEKKKEEADRKKEEAERKARAQPKIANFFAKKEGAAPKIEKPAIVDEAAKARSASPLAQRTDYDKLAIPFFIHQSVKLAQSKFMIDDEAREAKTQILTDFLAGKRSPVKPNLGLVAAPVARGKSYPRVKDLMAEQEGGLSNSVNLTADSLSLPNRKLLKSIPVKQFSFHEDVRPGYYGTVTSVHSVPTLKKMAKKPTAKDLPLNYDYDSEAEWVQGDEEEDAEGLDDMSDDEEEEDDDKSIDEFLDDSDDIRRGPLMTAGSMEPESSGICFEDHTHRNPNSEMHKFRMDFLIRKQRCGFPP